MVKAVRYSLLVAGIAVAAPSVVAAAVITGAHNDAPGLPADLTELGGVDWAYWNTDSGTGVSSQSPLNRKSGVTPRISAATAIAGVSQQVRGSSTPTAVTFKFTDGTSAVSSTGVAVRGVFNATLSTVGTGVTASVLLPDTQPYKVSVWVSGYNVDATFTAALAGASSYTNSSFTYAGTKTAKLYELQVQANNPGDSLALSYVVSKVNSSNAHAVIAGVAVDVIPEPAALALLAPLMILPLRRRR